MRRIVVFIACSIVFLEPGGATCQRRCSALVATAPAALIGNQAIRRKKHTLSHSDIARFAMTDFAVHAAHTKPSRALAVNLWAK